MKASEGNVFSFSVLDNTSMFLATGFQKVTVKKTRPLPALPGEGMQENIPNKKTKELSGAWVHRVL